jgi:hypothetical protein
MIPTNINVAARALLEKPNRNVVLINQPQSAWHYERKRFIGGSVFAVCKALAKPKLRNAFEQNLCQNKGKCAAYFVLRGVGSTVTRFIRAIMIVRFPACSKLTVARPPDTD